MITKITSQEQEFMTKYISSYSATDDSSTTVGVDNINLDYFLKDWAEEKSDYLYALFGGQLVLSKEIDVMNSDPGYLYNKARHNTTITDFVWREHKFRSVAKNFFDALVESPNPRASEEQWRYLIIDNIFNFNNMAENKYPQEEFVIVDPVTRAEIKIQKGMKMTRLIGKLKNVFGITDDEVKEVQNAISEVRNAARVTGTLCLSIHPIDFMTMSDSSYDWSSCMSWKRTGCYRAGTVATMSAPCTVVAYVLGKHETFEDRVFAKKWRSLYIVDSDVICSVKGYPYANPQVDEIVVNWLAQLYNDNIKQDAFDLTRIKKVNGVEYNLAKSCYPELEKKEDNTGFFEFEAGIMYNDFCSGLTGVGVISREAFKNFMENDESRVIELAYGKDHTHCAACGSVVYDMEDRDYDCDDSRPKLLCDECEPMRRCCECGRIIYGDYCHYDDNGEMYCEDCYNDLYEYDVVAQRDDYREDMVEFNINFNKVSGSVYYGMTNLSEWELEWITPEGHDRLDEQDQDYSVQLNWEEDITLEGKQILWATFGGYWRRLLVNAGYSDPNDLETPIEIKELKNASIYSTSVTGDVEFRPVTIDSSSLTLNLGEVSWVDTIVDNYFVSSPPTISGAFTF